MNTPHVTCSANWKRGTIHGGKCESQALCPTTPYVILADAILPIASFHLRSDKEYYDGCRSSLNSSVFKIMNDDFNAGKCAREAHQYNNENQRFHPTLDERRPYRSGSDDGVTDCYVLFPADESAGCYETGAGTALGTRRTHRSPGVFPGEVWSRRPGTHCRWGLGTFFSRSIKVSSWRGILSAKRERQGKGLGLGDSLCRR